ncbi:glycosyltransferase family 2 protein [Bacteriovorax sp. Seq25_V]|uniref:glycosyltransferase family 2 protein n=1 Tax=Bacteriovorax sp. Seq25_V TaxID=1201288 RepID=UPI000389E456|nr:glycosyltransferase family 2 protein [Bacteriovorax sp. Seq25_V]EQC45702.1 glycosyltransferase, group 2 family protein [Bacteriovorax sp. Seq25_V]
MNIKKTVFIPCYNCEKQLVRLFSALEKTDLTQFEEIVFIENCSTDNTLAHLMSYKDSSSQAIKVISHQKNYGLGGSFKSAVKYCRENSVDYLFWFHGDFQATVEDLKKMYDLVVLQNPDCVFGSRFMSQSERFNYSSFRYIGNLAIMALYSLFLFTPIKELGSGLNAYKVSSLSTDIEDWPNHIAFDANLLFLFYRKKTIWMPINWINIDQVSNARNFRVAKDLIKMLFCYFFTRRLMYLKNSEERHCEVF